MTQMPLKDRLKSTRLAIRLTRAGMVAERLVGAFWPLAAILLAVLGCAMLGLQDFLPTGAVRVFLGLAAVGAVAAVVYAFRRLRWPTRVEAMRRLDATLPGRPLQALLDTQAVGDGDPQSQAIWQAHKDRMLMRAGQARPVPADLRVSRQDPFGLRFVAVLIFAVAVLFGSIWRVGSVSDVVPGAGPALASGPVWEGWAESPGYTGRPTIYLNDISEGTLAVPVGTRITLRFYGAAGALSLSENVSEPAVEPRSATAAEQDFVVVQDGEIAVNGPSGRVWDVTTIADLSPQVALVRAPEASVLGEMTLPFTAEDDYGVESGSARFDLDLASVDRRHGLAIEPDPRPAINVPLPMPFTGQRAAFEEALIEDFSGHPWANLPVTLRMTVTDASQQQGESESDRFTLPGRRFFDPLAAAIIEQRRDLLWSKKNAPRVAQMLRAVAYKPDEVFRKDEDAARLRGLIEDLEAVDDTGLTDEQRDSIAADLWAFALELEEGDLSDALERLNRARERLEQAMRDGASDAEIAELMRELRRATDDYMRQLSRQAQLDAEQNGADQPPPNTGEMLQMNQDDLQRMMDRIQELMEQGRMAEAEQALRELQQMLENMRVTQGQGGGSGQSPGEQAMDGLSETLREQQGLSDEAFRDLQEQFNPNRQPGQGQGQGQGEQGTNDQNQSQNGGDGQDAPGGDTEGSLADRQEALRDELQRQQGSLPGAGTPEGDAARDALDRAGRAMDGAEQDLREGDFAGAIDNQSRAMEALREGLRALGEALQQEAQNRSEGQETTPGERSAQARDPLGRATGPQGSIGSDEAALQGEDVYRRARDLLDEIRRRAADGERPDTELEYLQRLLDRF